MPSISNIKIERQSGSDNTYFATWTFNDDYKPPSSGGGGSSGGGSVRVGSLVTIKSGATWYNGVRISSWVFNERWYVYQLKGSRAVLNKNQSGSHSIMSPINVNNLNVVSRSLLKATVRAAASSNSGTLDHYEVSWYYDTGNGVWFEGVKEQSVTETNTTYSPPDNAIRIKFYIKPIAKTHKVNDNDVAYWTASQYSKEYDLSYSPPEKPPAPTVEIDKYTLTATVANVSDPRTDEIQFEIYNGTKLVNTGIATVLTCQASYSCTVSAGGKYRVRCRSANILSTSKVYGEWTDFSGELTTIPSALSKPPTCAADSESSVKLSWDAVDTAESYKIEYSSERKYFDSASGVSSITVTNTTAYVTGLETGKEWFFRVCATNEKGDSAWSEIVSTVIGSKPVAPTTWSNTTTVITGEPLNLYWIHNCEDGSSETYAELEITIDGAKETYTIKKSIEEDEKDKTSVYPIDTSKFIEGTVILWRVRTAGATKEYGDWSILRTINVYAPPTLELSMEDSEGVTINTLTAFPFYISGLAGPKTQAAIGYHLSISSDETYTTVDQIGNEVVVNANEEVYSKYFDTKEALMVEMTPANIDLANGKHYTVTCTVSMNSGLTATSHLEFVVEWTENVYNPNAEIGIDMDTFSAYIRPFCTNTDGLITDEVTLTVYRKEFDGSFVEIVGGIANSVNVYITDPHPALDYARYRIVATSKTTGAVSYYDPPGYPVGCSSIIIQWDEDWGYLEYAREDRQENPTWTGSIIKLPYNVDVSESNGADVSLVEYIGRKHPVSYYGTQIGYSSTWNAEIPKTDAEVLHGLRQLQTWMGDVYVREPSGSGYWANVSVSFNQKHSELTIPVSLSIKRVEGGV
nr:MAG TPA: FN3 [Caudoviricetes sp.]